MLKKTIRDVKLEGKRVLVRVDFNVPLDIRTGAIANGNRIKYTLPTINYLVNHDARVILCSHLGRPNGKIVKELSLKQVAVRLSELIQLIHLPVPMVSDCIGDEVKKAVGELKDGQILLLENLRFHPEEEANDPQFAKALAANADIYVDDAFGTAHRAHASTVGVAKYLPSYFGFLMEREVETLGRIMANPEHPFAALLGGAKVSDKISLIENIISKLDFLLIGGGMAANFLKAKGYDVGHSKIEVDKMDLALKIVKRIEQNHVSLFLPVDVVVTDKISDQAKGEVVAVAKIPLDKYIVDIGPQTVAIFSEQLKKCQTIFWNGPMGIFEMPQFANGTKAMVNLLADVKASTIVGGGSTAEVVEEMDMTDKITHVSTGGGASLEFLEGKVLPGIAALQDK
jgi:phosphoglycerate kinase